MPCALDDDVLELVAQYCSIDDLRQMRVVSRRPCTLFTPHAFRQLDIWFTHSWIDAIYMRLGQLTDRYAYLETYIQQVVVHFRECNYRLASSIASTLMRLHQLDHVREVSDSPSTYEFGQMVEKACERPELRHSSFNIDFHHAQFPLTRLSLSAQDRSCTLYICSNYSASTLLPATSAASWVPAECLDAVVMADVRIPVKSSLRRFLPLDSRSSRNVRRLVLHHVYIDVDLGMTWADIWNGACELWLQLAQVDVEDCGYVNIDTSGTAQANHTPHNVIKDDATAFRRLQALIHSRRAT